MLKVDNISINYSSELFKELSFVLGNREKVGLIGLNGTGKSTLLKIIAGLEEPDSGRIELSKHESIGYLPQEFDLDKEGQAIFLGEFLEELVDFDMSEFFRVEKIMSQLEFKNYDIFQTLNTLSPGQKMKSMLARLLIKQPTILLLDEPTNHLDIDGILWFEKFVQKFEGVCIIISHDRAFLNNVVNVIFEIDEKKLYTWHGNYDEYLIQKDRYKLERAEQLKAQERKRAQLEKLIENSRKIKDGKKRGKAIRAAEKRMEREVTRNEITEYQAMSVSKFSIDGIVHQKKRILKVNNLGFGYTSDNMLLQNLDLEIYGNEVLWLFGPNGIGKTTLIKLITGQLKPVTGEIRWGESITWDYFSQEQKHLNFEQTVESYFFENTNINFNQSFKYMDKFLFTKDMRYKKIKNLSPGQRARLSFAAFSSGNYDCLILDEPTNHLDIRTKEVIEESLKEFKGAIILISHDRYFAENLEPNRILTIEDRTLVRI